MRKVLFVTLAAVLALAVATRSESAIQFYSIRLAPDELAPDWLVLIDTMGSVSPVGPLGFDVVDADLTMVQGSLYALSNQVPPLGTAELWELNPINGATLAGPVSVPKFAEGLAHVGKQLKIGFDDSLPTDLNSERLGDLDPTTGNITNDFSYSDVPPSPSGADFDALGVSDAGTLYSSNGIPLYYIGYYRVDPVNRTTNRFASFPSPDPGPPLGSVYANDVEVIGTKLFGIDSVNNQLHRIDVNSGTLDWSVPLDGRYVGLATADPCPSAHCFDCSDICDCADAKPSNCIGSCGSGICTDVGGACACQEPPTPTPTVTPTPILLDHFTCYKAGATRGSIKFPGIPFPPGVSLTDQFGPSIVEVKKPKFLCAPTNKMGEDPTAPTHSEHLKGYQVKNSLKPVFPTSIKVVDQFNPGVLFVDAKKQSHLLVPTVKDRVTPPPLPGAFSTDHFQCYKVGATKGMPKFVPVLNAEIEDQFGIMHVDVKKPKFLCNPVDMWGENPTAPEHGDHLMCYRVKQVKTEPKFVKVTGVFVNNGFGHEQLDVKKPSELCVPAAKNPVCGNNIVERLTGEECDDGNTVSGDGCSSSCKREFCGDGVTQSGIGEECDGVDDAACPGLCGPVCWCGRPSPVTEDLTTCNPPVTDTWQFNVTAGQSVMVQADTVDNATAADLCFSGSCPGQSFSGDDDFACTFPPPAFGCPLDTFAAPASGSCTVGVTLCSSSCADPSKANYQLRVTLDGTDTLLTLTADDTP